MKRWGPTGGICVGGPGHAASQSFLCFVDGCTAGPRVWPQGHEPVHVWCWQPLSLSFVQLLFHSFKRSVLIFSFFKSSISHSPILTFSHALSFYLTKKIELKEEIFQKHLLILPPTFLHLGPFIQSSLLPFLCFYLRLVLSPCASCLSFLTYSRAWAQQFSPLPSASPFLLTAGSLPETYKHAVISPS